MDVPDLHRFPLEAPKAFDSVQSAEAMNLNNYQSIHQVLQVEQLYKYNFFENISCKEENKMKFLKKNQVIIYVTALMLVVAGYMNFTANGDLKSTVQTASSEEEIDKMANIGDAQLVSSNVVSENQESVSNENNAKNESTNEILDTENVSTTNEEKNQGNTSEKSNAIETSGKASSNNDDYFSSSKLERDAMYSQMLETYENILNSSNSLETQKQSATEEIKKINDTKNSIMICENLIKTKGFENSIIFVNGESISVVVKDEQLTTEKVAQIQNIISREMNAKIENIHISNK